MPCSSSSKGCLVRSSPSTMACSLKWSLCRFCLTTILVRLHGYSFPIMSRRYCLTVCILVLWLLISLCSLLWWCSQTFMSGLHCRSISRGWAFLGWVADLCSSCLLQKELLWGRVTSSKQLRIHAVIHLNIGTFLYLFSLVSLIFWLGIQNNGFRCRNVQALIVYIFTSPWLLLEYSFYILLILMKMWNTLNLKS